MSVILTDEMLEITSYSQRYEASKRARETFRVDQGRLCICPLCSGQHFRKDKDGLQSNETEGDRIVPSPSGT